MTNSTKLLHNCNNSCPLLKRALKTYISSINASLQGIFQEV